MLVYDKISRYLPNRPDIISFSLGKEKTRIIKKGLDAMKDRGYVFGVTPLTLSTLDEFYPLYVSYINSKKNANPKDLVAYYTPRLGVDDVYFSFIRDASGSLLAGAILVHKTIQEKNTLMLSFRASLPGSSFQKLHLGSYLEYMFFDFGLSLGVDWYSRGRDRNGYGFFGSDIGVCIHKLQLHFVPYIANHAIEASLDEADIDKTSLFFVSNDISGKFDSVTLYVRKEEKNLQKNIDLIHILRKRGFVCDIREL